MGLGFRRGVTGPTVYTNLACASCYILKPIQAGETRCDFCLGEAVSAQKILSLQADVLKYRLRCDILEKRLEGQVDMVWTIPSTIFELFSKPPDRPKEKIKEEEIPF